MCDFESTAEPRCLASLAGSGAFVIALLGYPTLIAAQAGQPPSSSERDYAAGRRLLDAAIQATGDSAALAALGTLTLSFCAKAVEIGQSARPDAPYDTIPAAGHRIYDLAHRKYAQDWTTEFRGGIPLALHELVTDSGAYTTDLLGGVVLAVGPSGLAGSQRRVEDNAPYAPLVILDRARRNAASVRLVREPAGTGAGPAVLFAERGTVTTLRFDRRTHLLESAETLFDNWAVGLTEFRAEFRDYHRIGGVALAQRVTTWFQHSLLTDVNFSGIARGAAPPHAFVPPRDPAHAVPIGGPLQITIDSVAPHVWAVRFGQTAGPNFGFNPPFAYAQLLVELSDRLMLVDAPWSSSAQQSVIDTLRTLFPGKLVGIVAFTHYHSDHFGGLRPFLAGGTTLVTTPGNRKLIERVAAVSHPSDPVGLSQPRAAPRIETFTGRHTIADAEAPVELHEVGGGHADEMVVAYLPRQQVLFATDLFGIFPARGGPGERYEAERVLARYAQRRGWVIRTVVSGHGTIEPGADLGEVLAQGAPPAQPVVSCHPHPPR